MSTTFVCGIIIVTEHIVNGSNVNLTSAVGDLRNTMALSAIISPIVSARSCVLIGAFCALYVRGRERL